jgi:hypothetical protein
MSAKSTPDLTRLVTDLKARNPNLTPEEFKAALIDFIKSPEGAAYKEAVISDAALALYDEVMKQPGKAVPLRPRRSKRS